jgi:hypothetical protein
MLPAGLCTFFGRLVEQGRTPENAQYLGRIVQDISYHTMPLTTLTSSPTPSQKNCLASVRTSSSFNR